jgi:tRNA (guanine-N7-)-methyltransferase
MSETDLPRFYGRRSGKKLRPNALARLDELLPRLTVDLPESGQLIDPVSLFDKPVSEVWLEIGFGGGEHLAAQALLYPNVGLIGGEVFRNGIASLMAHLTEQTQQTVRVFPEDIRRLFPALPNGCLSKVFLLFPDPWPKSRHADRRFVGPENLDSLARLMGSGGELRVASDDPIYARWAEKHLEAHPSFSRVQVTQNRNELPGDWPVTRYESKLLAGHPPTFFRYVRRLT